MGENTSQIERDILRERAELGRNFLKLDRKAKELFDWRVHYQRQPAIFLGAALGAGMLVGALTAGEGPSEMGMPRSTAAKLSFAERGPKAAQLVSTWNHISDALLGLVTAKAVDAIAEYLPGFRDEYERHRAGRS